MDLREWDRRPDESAKAYQAFEVFLDLGPNRSLDGAFRSAKGVSGVRRAPGTWQHWYAIYKWRERADAYDRFIAHQNRIARETEQFKQIEDHARRAVQLSRSMFSASVRALILATQRLESINVMDVDVKDLSSVLRAAAHLGQVSMTIEQDVLGIQALLDKMQELDDR